jgi:thermostable 8-oxoguanine DNA glycosylase
MNEYFTVDPNEVIRFDRTDEELQVFWLFCGCVAGKTASTQARLLAGFLEGMAMPRRGLLDTPFNRIRYANERGLLLDLLIESRLGQYNRLFKFMVASLDLDLRNCTVEQLEAIPGCGPKTARMFLMFSRPNQRFAALDTHVLKHLRANGIQAVPMTTPPAGKTYRRLEAEFLKLADASGMSVADYDLTIWKRYSGNAD